MKNPKIRYVGWCHECKSFGNGWYCGLCNQNKNVGRPSGYTPKRLNYTDRTEVVKHSSN